ncbi:MAG: hypothetical protein ACJAUY_001878 [Cognaticolwellia sp.]|jgi:hypothetical protein
MKKILFKALSLAIILMVVATAQAQELEMPKDASNKPTRSYSNAEMSKNFFVCTALAASMEEWGEVEFYMNATVDFEFETSDGRIGVAMVRKRVKDMMKILKVNYAKAGFTKERIMQDYKKACGYGDTRGYATWYSNQRKNMNTAY